MATITSKPLFSGLLFAIQSVLLSVIQYVVFSFLFSPTQVLEDEFRRRSKDLITLKTKALELDNKCGGLVVRDMQGAGPLAAITDVTHLEERWKSLSERMTSAQEGGASTTSTVRRKSSTPPSFNRSISDSGSVVEATVITPVQGSQMFSASPRSTSSPLSSPTSTRPTSADPTSNPAAYIEALKTLQGQMSEVRASGELEDQRASVDESTFGQRDLAMKVRVDPEEGF